MLGKAQSTYLSSMMPVHARFAAPLIVGAALPDLPLVRATRARVVFFFDLRDRAGRGGHEALCRIPNGVGGCRTPAIGVRPGATVYRDQPSGTDRDP